MSLSPKYILFIAMIIAIAGIQIQAETYYVTPYPMTCEQINQIIADANSGDADPNNPLLRDIIHFLPGTYHLRILGPSRNEKYFFIPNRNYIFDSNGVTIWGMGIEHVNLIQISNGGNMNIDGSGKLTMGNSLVPIGIGTVPFKNIDIRGINFTNVYEWSILYQNMRDISPLLEPAIKVSYCTADSGIKFAKFARAPPVDENSPYPRVENCTVRDLTGWGVDLPSYDVPSEGAVSGWTKIVLGQNDIKGNVWNNCSALVDPHLHEYFSSPEENRYKDVNEPFIGEPDDDNIIVDDNDFFNGTLFPIMFGRVHLKRGDLAGALSPVATLKSLSFFAEHYLSNPNCADWDQRADFNVDFRIDLKDFPVLAQRWYSIIAAPIAYRKVVPVAHWKLDERAGNIADDYIGNKDGTLIGEPNWMPEGGKIKGALLLDGVNDYVSIPFVLNPAGGPFSAFAWVKTDTAGRVVLSQITSMISPGGKNWLCADAQGRLMSELPYSGSSTPLVSEFIITDSQWHRVGFVWDGSRRHLYADGNEVAKDNDAISNLLPSNKELYIGAIKNFINVDRFWSGLIDDVRIYDRALDSNEVKFLIN